MNGRCTAPQRPGPAAPADGKGVCPSPSPSLAPLPPLFPPTTLTPLYFPITLPALAPATVTPCGFLAAGLAAISLLTRHKQVKKLVKTAAATEDAGRKGEEMNQNWIKILFNLMLRKHCSIGCCCACGLRPTAECLGAAGLEDVTTTTSDKLFEVHCFESCI